MQVDKLLNEERNLLLLLLINHGLELDIEFGLKTIKSFKLNRWANEVAETKLSSLGYDYSYEDGSNTYVYELDSALGIRSGDVVFANKDITGIKKGTKLFVYYAISQLDDIMIAVIDANGKDHGEFYRYNDHFTVVKKKAINYKFHSFKQLKDDFDYGIFDKAFEL